MKEQAPYNSTPDQGWAKMKPLLDEALPEGRSTRRIVVFWWAASAIVVAGLSAVLLFNPTASMNNETGLASSPQDVNASEWSVKSELNAQISSEHTVAVTADESTIEESTTELSAVISDEKTDHQKEVSVIKATQIKTTNEAPVEQVVNQKYTIEIAEHQNEGKSNMSSLPILSNPNTGKKEVGNMTDGEALSTDVNIAIARVPVSQIAPVRPLPLVAMDQEMSSDPIAFTNTNKKAKRMPALFSPTLAVSGLIGQNGGIGGYGGAGVDVGISRRFSLTTAVGYGVYKPNANFLGPGAKELSYGAFNPIVNFDPTNGLDNYVLSESINMETDYNAIRPLIETISQWQVDIGLNWRFSRRFYASGGVKFGFGTEAFSLYPIVQGDASTIPAYPKIDLTNSLSNYNVIRQSNTSVYFGLGYRLGRHFDIVAHWLHGFDQYVINGEKAFTADLSTSGRTDYIRGLSLGLKYTL